MSMHQPVSEVVHGLDVWEGYGPIDWAAVARSGVRFVYVRGTSAEAGVDRRVRENVRGAHAAGLDVGIYHVTWCGRRSPAAEAAHALALWRELREFLALPLAWVSDTSREPLPDLTPYLQRYERVAQDPSFQTLAEQPAFRQVLADLRNLSQTATPARSTLPLPPPPR